MGHTQRQYIPKIFGALQYRTCTKKISIKSLWTKQLLCKWWQYSILLIIAVRIIKKIRIIFKMLIVKRNNILVLNF